MQPVQTSGGMWNASRISEARNQPSFIESVVLAPNPKPYPIKPLGGPFRRWHLTPWQKTEATALLDDLSGRMGDDSGDTNYLDVLDTAINAAGNIYGAKQGLVPVRPVAGQYYPAGTSTMSLGMSTNTLLLLGAAVLGVVILAKK